MSIDDEKNHPNGEQSKAIDSIVAGWNASIGDFILPIVEGPPGTGKTTVGVNASVKYMEELRKPEIAYLCYTNFAADRALESFVELGLTSEQVIRVGDSQKVYQYDDKMRAYYMGYSTLDDLTPNQQRILKSAPILISTVHSAQKIFHEAHRKPLIIIDEYSQISPALFFYAMSKVKNAYQNPTGYSLLGDPNQLPVVTSQSNLRPNIGIYIQSKISDYEPHQLDVQYRMHQDICEVVNSLRSALNTYPLKTHESAKGRTLTDLKYTWNPPRMDIDMEQILSPQKTSVFINTDSLEGEEKSSLGGSKYFVSEARLAARLSRLLRLSYSKNNGARLEPVILSPYTAQVGLIKSLLPEEHRRSCFTIHKSQGREYPSVIVSFSRKNASKLIGFLGRDELRAQPYVASSRARAKLIILYSFSTFEGHRDFDYMVEQSKHSYHIDAKHEWSDDN